MNQKSKISNFFQRLSIILLKPKFSKTVQYALTTNVILDVGIANQSYYESKLIFPNTLYHGIDIEPSAVTLCSKDAFFLLDLEQEESLNVISHKYDLIIVNHVLEHITRGETVFAELLRKLNRGGVMYIEFPSVRTALKRKKYWNYHFHDDPTHKQFYDLVTLANIAMNEDCKIISCGPVSTLLKDMLSIPRAFVRLILGKESGAALIHMQRKVDHMLIVRPLL